MEFRREGWIYEQEQCDTNLWKFLGNDVVNEDDEAVVVSSSVANAEDDVSEKKIDVINKSGNGEEFFLK